MARPLYWPALCSVISFHISGGILTLSTWLVSVRDQVLPCRWYIQWFSVPGLCLDPVNKMKLFGQKCFSLLSVFRCIFDSLCIMVPTELGQLQLSSCSTWCCTKQIFLCAQSLFLWSDLPALKARHCIAQNLQNSSWGFLPSKFFLPFASLWPWWLKANL